MLRCQAVDEAGRCRRETALLALVAERESSVERHNHVTAYCSEALDGDVWFACSRRRRG